MKFYFKMVATFMLATVSYCTYAQGINFQGVARSANGTIIAGSNISLRLSIISKSVDATPEFVETKTVVTNSQGIFSIVVGDSTNKAITGNFKNIVWADAPKFLKVEMDPSGGSNYINMGATQLQYVPYSFYSLGVAAANVNGILPLAKGGTGVGSIAELKSSLGIDKYGSNTNENIAIGYNALTSDTTNTGSIGIGYNAMSSNNTNAGNIGIGKNALRTNVDGRGNTALGTNALQFTTTGGSTAVGIYALQNNTTGMVNTALGSVALGANTTGSFNVAIGASALYSNTTGSGIVAIGANNGVANTTGRNLTSVGVDALRSNTTGNDNNAFGSNALQSNTTGTQNIGIGNMALSANTTGSNNIAIGNNALKNSTGSSNTGLGNLALTKNTTGSFNTSIGENALTNNTTGSDNIAVGSFSLFSNTTGSNNIAIGKNADIGSNNLTNSIAIGNGAVVTSSNTVQLGNQSTTKVSTRGIISSGKGFLAQGISAADRDAISLPEQGLIIYCNDCGLNGELQVFNGTIWKAFTLGTVTAGNSVVQGLLNGLHAYYSFSGNASESIGNANNGTVLGATLSTDKGSNVNSAYAFNGSTNYITLPNAFFGGVQKSQFSLSLNFYLDQLPSSNNSYYLWSKNGFWQGLGLSVDYQGKIYFGGSITTYKYQSCLSNNNVVAPSQWYNLVIVYDNTICKMYLNGTEITTVMETSNQSGTKLSDTMAGFVEFGQNAGGNSASTNTFGASHAVNTGYVTYLKGKMDEFRLYDRLLNQTEITYLATH